MNLQEMGWAAQRGLDIDQKSVARVISVHRGLCRGITVDGPINIHLSGRFLFEIASDADRPVTGDFVLISPPFIDEQNHSAAVLKEILPRISKISRVASGAGINEQILVSNVDYAFIVTSANEDFSVNRLQRFVLLAEEGDVKPVILLSKIDLVDDFERLVTMITSRLGGLEVISVSSTLNLGLDLIAQKLVLGSTAVFLGSSGVGKSTIVNKLLGKEVQKTKSVRAEDAKGRHATTSRDLFFVAEGGMIIDTAGLREVHVLAGKEAVDETFKTVAKLVQDCKFSNCSHQNEQGCAINRALEDGELSLDEFNNYLKLLKESAFAQKKLSKSKSSNAKDRWKTINKNYKARRKFEGRD